MKKKPEKEKSEDKKLKKNKAVPIQKKQEIKVKNKNSKVNNKPEAVKKVVTLKKSAEVTPTVKSVQQDKPKKIIQLKQKIEVKPIVLQDKKSKMAKKPDKIKPSKKVQAAKKDIKQSKNSDKTVKAIKPQRKALPYNPIPIQPINPKCLISKNDLKEKDILTFINSFKTNLINTFHISEGSKLLVAVSGGVDSIVLLDLLVQVVKDLKIFVQICHFNHKLRAFSADKDEEFVKRLAERYGIKCYTDSGNVREYSEKNSYSIEQGARNLRYQFFERIAKSIDIPYIAMAHNADDSAETFLINLLRGTGLTGLAGIPEQRSLSKKIQIIRPLLRFSKSDIIRYANLRKLEWHEDETNSLMLYTRNKIRHDLIPKLKSDYNESIVESINRTSALIKSADSFIKDHLNSYMKLVKYDKKTDQISIRISLLKSLDKYIQGEIIQKALEERFKVTNISTKVFERITNLTDQNVGTIVEINKTISVLRDRLNLIFYKQTINPEICIEIDRIGEFKVGPYKFKLNEVTKKEIKYQDNSNIEFIDLDLLPLKLKIRNREPGDTFTPLGMTGNVKISDFLVNNKISLLDKRNILLLTTRSDVVWVCGLRINDKYKITPNSTRFLKIEMINNNG